MTVFGTYNEFGYRVWLGTRKGAECVYSAGNSPHDSQVVTDAEFGVGLRKLRSWCIRNCRETAEERGADYTGVERQEEDE
jgi:hypothetical protein